jgi:Domain of unknown function (DUF4783)
MLPDIRIMKKSIFTIILLLILSTAGFSFDIYGDITNAIRSGDAKSVAIYFNNSVDLTINSNEEVYSKTHAEQVLKEFFQKNPPKSFSLIHKGISKEGSKYAIGNMVSAKGIQFRIYFFIKQIGNEELIQEIRFEKQ